MNSCNLDEGSYSETACKLECVAVLLWALSLMAEMPGIDREADQKLLKRIPDDGSAPPAAMKLRDPEEIAAARDDVERWHWRSRTWFLVEREAEYRPDKIGLKLGWRSFDDMVRAVSRQYFEGGLLREIKDDDFVVKGVPVPGPPVRSVAGRRGQDRPEAPGAELAVRVRAGEPVGRHPHGPVIRAGGYSRAACPGPA